MKAKTKPPCSNTGVENKILSQKVDWLEVTFKRGKAVNLPTNIAQDYVECKPFNGYTIGTKYYDGRIHLVNPARPEMGQHIIWGGAALTMSSVEPMELLRHVVENGASVTRLDLAIDAHNYGLKPSDATLQIEAGNFKCRAQKYPLWKDAKERGYTQYIGTKSSEIFMRIYDKAAEMGLSGDHARVELVVRKSRAHRAASLVLEGAKFNEIMLGFVRFSDWKEWDEVMAGSPINLQAEKKDSNTQTWLLKQCAPALANISIQEGNDDFYFRFLDMVRLIVQENREIAS